ncbi:hypothetical protein [Sphingobium lignivorans]|uniref:Uncharacterized protein n=1 Tax=Sphingobium lignivorans TaxID=2735886 RepID=A0ABR6NFD2_9SPHN|nr:hypothetical protein [Sphingobium lignivorans]MBB5985985.1 hypothetical protein [Sphingobium lignivorans]
MSAPVERLIAVAIQRGPTLTSSAFKSHVDLRMALGDQNPYLGQPGDIDGFMSSTGRFLTRRDAVSVAIKAGQLSPRWLNATRELLSSDINWKGVPVS